MKQHTGFTLIEVMFALAIVSIALTAVIRVTSNAASNEAWLIDTTFAQWVALNRLAELRIEDEWPTTGKQNGKVTFADISWHWTQQVSKTPEADFRRIDVSVHKQSLSDADPIVTVTSFLAKPTGSPTTLK